MYSTLKTPGQVAHNIFHHIVSLQQDAMDSIEPTLSNSNGTDADNDVEIGWNDTKSEKNQSKPKAVAGSQGLWVALKSAKAR